MVAHIVLFRPKAELDETQRAQFVAALQYALTNIASIKRARVGRRVTLGRVYDQQNVESYPYVALLEFDSQEDLRAYLDHPAHEALGAQFYSTAASANVCDFELIDATRAAELLAT